MSGYGTSVARGTRASEALLWAGAGLVMLTVHVGVAAWLMREEPAMPADEAPPAAVMIELAPEPEALFTEANEVAPDQQTAEASTPAEEVETPRETLPEEVAEQVKPEPVEEAAQAEPQPAEPVREVAEAEPEEPQPPEEEVEEVEPVEEEVAAIPDAEVPIPIARPKPPEDKKPEQRKEAVRKKTTEKVEKPRRPDPEKPLHRPRQQQASKQAMQAQAQVTRSNRNAARQSAAGLFSSVSPARWQSRLMAHLERRKRYPSGARSRGEQGTVHVRFRIDDAGNVLSVSLAGSSGFPELDNEVLSLIRRASPVPAPPPGVNKTITAPVRFSTR